MVRRAAPRGVVRRADRRDVRPRRDPRHRYPGRARAPQGCRPGDAYRGRRSEDLRVPEREVLDTLVDAGVARSRSHALAWCVRLVSERQEEWLADLREALKQVQEVRKEGPKD